MYDRKHILLTWGGTLPGDEEWSCGIRLAGGLSESGGGSQVVITDQGLAELMGSYSPAVKEFHGRPATGISNRVMLTRIKCAYIGTDGRYLAGQTAMVEENFVGLPGTGGGTSAPNQVTLAVTTTTAVTRGLAKMGRFYLPIPALVPGIDGLIPAAQANDVAGSAKTFIEAISDVPGVDIIMSPGAAVMSKVGAGRTNRITGVKVGRVLDTQRRRRRSLPEGYQTSTVDQGSA